MRGDLRPVRHRHRDHVRERPTAAGGDGSAHRYRAVRTHAWVVLENEGRVVGYAYGGPFSSRAAYRWSCEVSVYLERGRRRTGGGRALYDALFARLAQRGFRTVVAGMTLPNDASVGLLHAMGSRAVRRTVGLCFVSCRSARPARSRR